MLTGDRNYVKKLSQIDVKDHIEKKNGLSYLKWMWAWQIVKQEYIESSYKVYEDEHGNNYFTDGRTCWVKCEVKLVTYDDDGNRIEDPVIEMLPVMDFKNRAIPLEQVTSTDVNKSIQRCLTKCIARLGLGWQLYVGSDDVIEPEADRQERMGKIRELQRDVVSMAKNLTTKMTDVQKKEFVETVVKATIGTTNPLKCEDEELLEELKEKISKLKPGKAA